MAGLNKEQKAAKALLAKAVELSGVTAEEFAKLSADEQAAFTAKAQEAIDAAAAEAKPKDQEVDDSHLIKVSKEGVELEVHPACLADHKRLGWVEV